MSDNNFLDTLERVIQERLTEAPDNSYTARLARDGIKRIAQKVGEEGVELALAGAAGDEAELIDEAADLFYHVLVLLNVRGIRLSQVADKLRTRHSAA